MAAPRLVIIAEFQVKQECVKECERVLCESARGSRAEPGCVRFDVLRDQTDPCRLEHNVGGSAWLRSSWCTRASLGIVTYEAFLTAAAMEQHKEQPHVKAWGAFQYGARQPIVKKVVHRLGPVDFEQSRAADDRLTSKL